MKDPRKKFYVSFFFPVHQALFYRIKFDSIFLSVTDEDLKWPSLFKVLNYIEVPLRLTSHDREDPSVSFLYIITKRRPILEFYLRTSSFHTNVVVNKTLKVVWVLRSLDEGSVIWGFPQFRYTVWHSCLGCRMFYEGKIRMIMKAPVTKYFILNILFLKIFILIYIGRSSYNWSDSFFFFLVQLRMFWTFYKDWWTSRTKIRLTRTFEVRFHGSFIRRFQTPWVNLESSKVLTWGTDSQKKFTSDQKLC